MLAWFGDHGWVATAAAGVAVLSLICVCWLARLLWAYPRAPARRRVLGDREEAIARAAADAMFPADGPIPVSGVEAGCVAWLDAYLARSHAPQRLLVLMLLWFNEYGPLLFGPARRRMSQMSERQRHAYFAGAAASRIYLRRVAALTLRGLMTMGYLSNGDVMRRIGMEPNLDPFGLDAVDLARPEPTVPIPAVSGERLKAGHDGAELFDDVG